MGSDFCSVFCHDFGASLAKITPKRIVFSFLPGVETPV